MSELAFGPPSQTSPAASTSAPAASPSVTSSGIIEHAGPRPPSAEPILKTIAGLHAAKYLFVGSKLGLFEALAEGPLFLDALAEKVEAPPRTVRIVADALVAQGILSCDPARGYTNSATAAAFLAGAPGEDLRPVLQMWDGVVYKQWAHLEDSIRRDRRTYGYFDFTTDEQHLFTSGVASMTGGSARAIAANYDFIRHRSLLDVGGGTGSFVLAARERHPSLEVSLFEMAKTTAAVRRALAETPGGDAVKIVEGDLFADPIPRGHDVFLVANVLHLYLPERNIELLRRIREACEPGARLLLVDFWTNPQRTEPAFACMLAGQFQIVSGEGDVYSVDVVNEWLEAAGFTPLVHQPFAGAASLIVAEAK